MAGFEKNESYYIPRIVQELPWSDEELCTSLFPDILDWREVIGSDEGDGYGRLLVDDLLPYFAKVACQDGIYWVEKFPLHPASNLLKQRLRTNNINYEVWAARQRNVCRDLETNFSENQLEVLRGAVCTSYNNLIRRQDRYNTNVLRQIQYLSEKSDRTMQDQRTILQNQWQLNNMVQNIAHGQQQIVEYLRSLGRNSFDRHQGK